MGISEIKKLAMERLTQIKEIQLNSLYYNMDECTRQVTLDAIYETQRKIEELKQ